MGANSANTYRMRHPADAYYYTISKSKVNASFCSETLTERLTNSSLNQNNKLTADEVHASMKQTTKSLNFNFCKENLTRNIILETIPNKKRLRLRLLHLNDKLRVYQKLITKNWLK